MTNSSSFGRSLLALCLCGVSGLSSSASAALYTSFSGNYELQSSETGIGAYFSSVDNTVTLQVGENRQAMKIRVVQAGKDVFRMETGNGSMALQIGAASDAYPLQLAPVTDQPDQWFRIVETSPGNYLLLDAYARLFLDVHPTLNKVVARPLKLVDASRDGWRLVPEGALKSSVQNVALKNLFSGKVMQSVASNTAVRDVEQGSFAADESQIWQLTYQDNGYVTIGNGAGTSALTDKRITSEVEGNVQIDDSHSHQQHFALIRQADDGNWVLRSKVTGQRLEVRDWYMHDGAALGLSAEPLNDSQRWTLSRASDLVVSSAGEEGAAHSGASVFEEGFENLPVGTSWQSMAYTRIESGCGVDRSKCLRVKHVPTDYGSFRIGAYIPVPASSTYTLQYDVMFESGFDFARGGKLPGFAPADPVSGCDTVTADSWSARLMWGAQGVVKPYIYHQGTQRCGEGPVANGFQFRTGQWHAVTVNLQLNGSAVSSDGRLQLFVDGQPLVDYTGLRLRGTMDASSNIHYLFFANFFGGSDKSWAPSKTVYMRFDNFRVLPALVVRQKPGS